SAQYDLLGVAAAGRLEGKGKDVPAANDLLARAGALARRENFFHWQTFFPDVFSGRGGFDIVIGNPPWDRIKLQEVEWFAERSPEIAQEPRAADRKKRIAALRQKGAPLWREYQEAVERAEANMRVLGKSGDYPLLGGGDVNLYSLFVERAQSLICPDGLVALLTPSGIAADLGAAAFFRGLSESGRLSALFDFENRQNPGDSGGSYFPDVDSRFKFCALVFGGKKRTFPTSRCAFYLHDINDLDDAERVLELASVDFRRVNPNTGAAPIFRNRRDADITLSIYREHPVLVDKSGDGEKRVWPVKYSRMFDMTNDSALFKTREELERDGFEPAALNRWRKGEREAVPLYEGKMVQMYDHRAADVVVNPQNLHRAAQQETISAAEKESPNRFPTPQYWVSFEDDVSLPAARALLCFKDVTAPTNIRTMIAALAPQAAFGNTLPLILADKTVSLLLLANFNSFVFDFLARQKVQGQHLNWYILEQLPVIAPPAYEKNIGAVRIADFIREQVLRLSYTAHDLAPFARDLGYTGAPFLWDEEDRALRKAALDALFMHLYGVSPADAEYILDTFPIAREQDQAAHGDYRTKKLILAGLEQLAAGQWPIPATGQTRPPSAG
ncbi:MAG: restriction endonuclease, partial [Candidatus Accumulibacter sp.]|nr:restriction endonuclease [Accumulibacter sp.]